MPSESEARAVIEKIAADRRAKVNDLTLDAFRILAEQLYAHDVHFFLELIQNAEDNLYTKAVGPRYIRFDLEKSRVIVRNNEDGFSSDDVDGLCRMGRSKKTDKTSGYVGEKGIGFKSVFVVSSTPQIFSNGYSFQLSNDTYVVPQWCQPPQGVNPRNGTTIVLPLKDDYENGNKQLNPYGIIDSRILLFLRNLNQIEIVEKDHQRTFAREDLAGGRVAITEGKNKSYWLTNRRELAVPSTIGENKRQGVSQREVIVALPVGSDGKCRADKDALIFAFLPTALRPGFNFIVQADFLLTASREDLLTDRKWNQWLRDEICATFVEAIRKHVPNVDFARSFYACVPFPRAISNKFFKPVAEEIIRALANEKVFLGESGKLRVAGQVLRAPKKVRELFPNDDLAELLGRDVEYLDEECQKWTEALDELDIADFNAELWSKALANEPWLLKRPVAWFIDLYCCLHDNVIVSPDALKRLPIVRLEGEKLARPADGTIYWSPREERTQDRYELGRFNWRVVGQAIAYRDPSTSAEAQRTNERNSKVREFLIQRLGVQYHRPLEIAWFHVLPHLESRLSVYKTVDELKADFGLILYLKEQWSDIQQAAGQEGARISRIKVAARIRQALPVPAKSLGNPFGVKPVGEVYLSHGFGGSIALESLFQSVSGVWFALDKFVEWDPAPARGDRKRAEWIEFLKAAGANTVLSVKRLPDKTGYALDHPGLEIPEGYRVVRVESELVASELDKLFSHLDGLPEGLQHERGRELLLHLEGAWPHFESEFGDQTHGNRWFEARYCYKPYGSGWHSESSAHGPSEFIRSLRSHAWVPTTDGKVLKPTEVWFDSGRHEFHADGSLLAARIGQPGLVEALLLRTISSPHEILQAIRKLAANGCKQIADFRRLFSLLDKARREGGLGPEYRDLFEKERVIFIPYRDLPYARTSEVSWRPPRDATAAFPALETHYPELFDLFHFLGVSELPNTVRAITTLRQISEAGKPGDNELLLIWEAYQVLAGTDDWAGQSPLSVQIEKFRREGKLFCRYAVFREAERVVLGDDFRVVQLFGRELDFLWLPDNAPLSIARRLADCLQLEQASQAERKVDWSPGQRDGSLEDAFDGSRRALIGYIQRDPARYNQLFSEGLLSSVAVGPIRFAERLAVHYSLLGKEVKDSRNLRALVEPSRIFVLGSESIDREEFAEAIERSLVNIPGVEEVLTNLMSRKEREREVYIRRKGYIVPDSDWQRLVDAFRRGNDDIAPEDTKASEAQQSIKPEGAGRADQESAGATTSDASPGVPFHGRTRLSSPRGSNEALRQRLGRRFPERDREVDEYLRETDMEEDLPSEQPQVEPEETGAVRKAVTILHAVNLEEAFLRFHPSAMALFDRASRPHEVMITDDDEDKELFVEIDYGQAIIHAGELEKDKVKFRDFIESYAVPPGSYLVLEATDDPELFHLHPIRLDVPQTLEKVSQWDLTDKGPKTEVLPKVRLEYQVHEPTYRSERRWEQRRAYEELIRSRNAAVLQDVYELLEEQLSTENRPLQWTEIHSKLLEQGHPCAYGSVLGVLYGYRCFEQTPDGRWRLRPSEEKELREGYAAALSDELPDRPPFQDSSETHTTGKPPSTAEKRGGVTPGALDETELKAIRQRLAALTDTDRSGWLNAATWLAQLFANLMRKLQVQPSNPTQKEHRHDAAISPLATREAGSSAPSSGSSLGTSNGALIPATSASGKASAPNAPTELADDYLRQGQRNAALTCALLGWKQAVADGHRALRAQAALRLALALREFNLNGLASHCYETADGLDHRRPRDFDLVKLAGRSANLDMERNRAAQEARKGLEVLLRDDLAKAYPEIAHAEWLKSALASLPKP